MKNLNISNDGGLFGKARPENFPNENDYRNPIVAEAMRVMGYVNRFNRGICRVQEELAENGNEKAIFDFKHITSFSVIVSDAIYFDSSEEVRNKVGIKSDETIDNHDAMSEKSRKTVGSLSGQMRDKYVINTVEIRDKFGATGLQILTILVNEPNCTIPTIAEKLNLNSSTIDKNIAKLKKENIIERVGSRKSGYWKIVTKK